MCTVPYVTSIYSLVMAVEYAERHMKWLLYHWRRITSNLHAFHLATIEATSYNMHKTFFFIAQGPVGQDLPRCGGS
jgi:hypothetical protein